MHARRSFEHTAGITNLGERMPLAVLWIEGRISEPLAGFLTGLVDRGNPYRRR